MDPKQQLQAMLALEANGWQLVAIYHSHPQGPETPSDSDVKQAYYPESLTMLVSLQTRNKPVVRVFQILGPTIIEKKMRIVQPSG
jgi:proteasome lid subunit RPN8/RPN11